MKKVYAGYHLSDSATAIEHLEALRTKVANTCFQTRRSGG
jgi:hypothetical protein